MKATLWIFCLLGIAMLTVSCRGVAVSAPEVKARVTEITVAQDGSGQFTNVQAAIMSVPMGTAANPVVIRIKPGVYREVLYVQREKRFGRMTKKLIE